MDEYNPLRRDPPPWYTGPSDPAKPAPHISTLLPEQPGSLCTSCVQTNLIPLFASRPSTCYDPTSSSPLRHETSYHTSIPSLKTSAAERCPWCTAVLSNAVKEKEANDDTEVEVRFRFFCIRQQHIVHFNQLIVFLVFGRAGESKATARFVPFSPLEMRVYDGGRPWAFDALAKLEQAQSWLKECETHEGCKVAERPSLPKRLVDVSCFQSDGGVRLKVVTPDDRERYAALSYCWGGSANLMTTSASLASHLAFIPAASLPQTVVDVVRVTRSLGLRYLWIDALCIIQDSKEDKRAEIRNMRNIYKNAYVTIVASSATSVHEGFLEPNIKPLQGFEIPLPRGTSGVNDREESEGDTGKALEKTYLEFGHAPTYWTHGPNVRAWCLEERYLSRRLLIFERRDLIWLCRCQHTHLDQDAIIPDDGRYFTFASFETSKKQEAVLHRWCQLVMHYSHRHLTKPEDAINAVAGIAEDFAERFGDVLGKYRAGLWEGHMQLLAWRREQVTLRRTEGEYVAPSWSWLSNHQGTAFDDQPWLKLKPDEERESLFEVLDVSVVNKEGAGPYGPIKDGYLKLRAPVLSGIWSSKKRLLTTDETQVDLGPINADSIEATELPERDVKALFLSKRSSHWTSRKDMNKLAVGFTGIILERANAQHWKRTGSFAILERPVHELQLVITSLEAQSLEKITIV
ncbi:MAG: hypothetical protein Q9159_003011 [Coniocarpon cinnabarinum]